MKTYRIISFLACLTLIGIHIYSLNYKDLRFTTNKGQYLGIVAMTLIGFSFLMGVLKDSKNKE